MHLLKKTKHNSILTTTIYYFTSNNQVGKVLTINKNIESTHTKMAIIYLVKSKKTHHIYTSTVYVINISFLS